MICETIEPVTLNKSFGNRDLCYSIFGTVCPLSCRLSYDDENAFIYRTYAFRCTWKKYIKSLNKIIHSHIKVTMDKIKHKLISSNVTFKELPTYYLICGLNVSDHRLIVNLFENYLKSDCNIVIITTKISSIFTTIMLIIKTFSQTVTQIQEFVEINKEKGIVEAFIIWSKKLKKEKPFVLLFEAIECFENNFLLSLIETLYILRNETNININLIFCTSTNIRIHEDQGLIEKQYMLETYEYLFINQTTLCREIILNLLLTNDLELLLCGEILNTLYDRFMTYHLSITYLIQEIYKACMLFYQSNDLSYFCLPLKDLLKLNSKTKKSKKKENCVISELQLAYNYLSEECLSRSVFQRECMKYGQNSSPSLLNALHKKQTSLFSNACYEALQHPNTALNQFTKTILPQHVEYLHLRLQTTRMFYNLIYNTMLHFSLDSSFDSLLYTTECCDRIAMSTVRNEFNSDLSKLENIKNDIYKTTDQIKIQNNKIISFLINIQKSFMISLAYIKEVYKIRKDEKLIKLIELEKEMDTICYNMDEDKLKLWIRNCYECLVNFLIQSSQLNSIFMLLVTKTYFDKYINIYPVKILISNFNLCNDDIAVVYKNIINNNDNIILFYNFIKSRKGKCNCVNCLFTRYIICLRILSLMGFISIKVSSNKIYPKNKEINISQDLEAMIEYLGSIKIQRNSLGRLDIK